MLPIFIGDDLASKVLLCGKSINFARVFCGVSENFMHRMEAKQSLLKIKWCAGTYCYAKVVRIHVYNMDLDRCMLSHIYFVITRSVMCPKEIQ